MTWLLRRFCWLVCVCATANCQLARLFQLRVQGWHLPGTWGPCLCFARKVLARNPLLSHTVPDLTDLPDLLCRLPESGNSHPAHPPLNGGVPVCPQDVYLGGNRREKDAEGHAGPVCPARTITYGPRPFAKGPGRREKVWATCEVNYLRIAFRQNGDDWSSSSPKSTLNCGPWCWKELRHADNSGNSTYCTVLVSVRVVPSALVASSMT